MKHGDIYDHFKGGEYFFDTIAFPKDDLSIKPDIRRDMRTLQVATHHETLDAIKLYSYGGIPFIDASVPHVIYQAEEDYNTEKVYARPVDDFFGYKSKPNGQLVQRFKRRKTKKAR